MALSKKHLPRKKVAAAGAGGGASVALISLAAYLGVDLTPEAASAITTLVAFAAGYFKSA